MALPADTLAAIRRVIVAAGAEAEEYVHHPWNVLRWIVAYEGNESEAATQLKRHLNIRHVMGLSTLPEEGGDCCPHVESHAPLSILGRNGPDDNKVLLVEMTGRLDIHGLVENIRISRFMRSRFRFMERVHRAVMAEEKESGRQGGGLLLMDLQHLSFSPSLLSILAGPYRIMWGTLFEQYPQMIQQIVLINAPTFVNILHSTCMPFIPSDYRKKIIICSASTPQKTLLAHIHPSVLPSHYGGESDDIQMPQTPFPKAEKMAVQLESVSIPAGRRVFHKYRLKKGDTLHIHVQTDQEFTLFYFHSAKDTRDEEDWQEIIAGCERPALPTLDYYTWKVPADGFYFVRFGNEKAWLLSVTIKVRYESQLQGHLRPIEEWNA